MALPSISDLHAMLQGNLQSPNLVGGTGLLSNIVNAIASPAVQTARTIGGAAFEGGRAISSALGNKNAYIDQNGNTVQDPFLSEQDLQNYDTNPVGQVVNQAKNSVALASYGLPIGGETSLAGNTIKMGALKGGALMGAAQSLPTAKNAGDIALGAAAGGVGGVVGNKIAGALAKPTESAVEGATEPSENALTLAGGRFLRGQYNARPATMEEFAPEHLQQLADWKIFSPKQVMNAAKVYTGADGIATNVIKKAVAQANPVSVAGLQDTAQDIMQHTYGVEPKDQAQFFKNTWQELASKVPSKPTVVNGVTTDISTKDPSETYTFLQNLRKEASNLASSGNQANRNLAPAYRQFANAVDDKLYLSPKLDANGVNIGGAGANDILNKATLSPEDSATLNKISPRLASDTQDVMQNGTIGDLKHLQQPLVTGNNAAIESAGMTKGSPISLRNVLAFYMAAHGNPLAGGAILAANTKFGENLLGRGLTKAGEASANMKFLPPITSELGGKVGASIASNSLPQFIPGDSNNNNPNQQINQNIPPTSSIAPTVKPIKYSDLPTDSTQVTSSTPLTPPTMISDKSGNPLAMAKTDNTAEELSIQDQLKAPSALYNPVLSNQLHQRLSQLQAIDAQSSPIMTKYNAASNTDNAVDTALTLLSNAPTGLFNANGLVSNYNTLFNGKYANLQAQLNILQQFYPTMAKTVLESPNADVAQGVLNQIKTRVHQDYVQFINTQTGNFAGTTPQSTTATNSFTPTATGLPPIKSNFKPLPPNPMLNQ